MDKRLEEFQQLLNELSAKGTDAAVDLLLRQMDADQARCLRLCAIPHEFDVAILRALAPDLSEDQATNYCDAFSQLSLVASRDESFAVHEEPRRYLFDQWLGSERQAEFRSASARLSDYFGALSARLKTETGTEGSDAVERTLRKRMFHLIGASRTEGLSEFERLCRQRREEMRFGQCETLIKLVREYDAILNPLEKAIVAYHEGKLAADRRHWIAAEEAYNRVLGTAEVSTQIRVKTLRRLGMIQDDQRHWNAAIDFFQKSLEVADERPDCFAQIIHLHLNLGSTYRDSGQLPKAEDLLQKGITLAKNAHDLSSLADGYNSLGTLYLKLNDIPKAIGTYELSLKHLEELRDKFRPAQVYNNLGNAYASQRDWQKSEEFFRRSLEIKRQAGDNAGQALTLTNLVRVYRAQQRIPDAIVALEQAATLFAEVRDVYNAARVKRDLARVYRSMNNVDLANLAFDEAAALFERCHETQEAQATREEAREKKRGLPWWAIAAIVLFVVFVLVIIVAAIMGKL
jgi:tetratricopeptide (TPR) repeat protein